METREPGAKLEPMGQRAEVETGSRKLEAEVTNVTGDRRSRS